MERIQRIFIALSDPTRLKMVKFLLKGEKCVCDIYPHIRRTQSTTSIQLKKLEKLNVITSRREGKYTFYRIKDFGVCDIFKALGHKGEFACQKKRKSC
ncbi:winged helix-turn-helix transcriptional regulator [Candidatus Pacearchaeota archaeon]|nr:winged helix-turn-helix transcriptional regulator [Candidatus Pacearchaeota archaeon]